MVNEPPLQSAPCLPIPPISSHGFKEQKGKWDQEKQNFPTAHHLRIISNGINQKTKHPAKLQRLVAKMPRAMDFNACLPTGDMAADPHSILASCPMCSYLCLCSLRQARLLLGRPQLVPWIQLVTRCW